MINNFNIEQFLDLTGYEETRKDRRKNNKEGKSTNEFFTPYSIVKRMCDKVPEEDWADPDKTWLEPAQGNGQFTIFILYRRIHEYNIPWRKALENMYALELMEDNVQEARQRIHELLRNISSDYIPEVADEIMDRNIVCADFFLWNFEEWRPYTDEEINSDKKLKEYVNKKKK